MEHNLSLSPAAKQRPASNVGYSVQQSENNLTLTKYFVDSLASYHSECVASSIIITNGTGVGNDNNNNNHITLDDNNRNQNEGRIKCHRYPVPLTTDGHHQKHINGVEIIDESKICDEDIDSDFSSQSCDSNCNDPTIECGSDKQKQELQSSPKGQQQLLTPLGVEKLLIAPMCNNQTKKLKEDNHDLKESTSSSSTTSASITHSEQSRQTLTQDRDEPPSPSYSPRGRILIQPHKLISLGERNGNSSVFNKHMPWFGIDVGGSLVKMVFFDPKDATPEETSTLKRIRKYLKSSKPYGNTGKRDAHLEMPNCVMNKRVGSLHFIRFATSAMPEFLFLAKRKRFAESINTVCATGGGAYKFEEDIKSNLGITLHKTDELDSIIYGIHYIDKYNPEKECYFLEDPLDDDKCVKVPYDFSRPYPYLVVNIGSGVSILAVYSSTSYSRISGSSIGGGTFLGLCSLLTQCETFDEAIRLAKAGSSTKIDKLVKDIYGGDYPKFDLSGDTVASSFGHMNMAEKRKRVEREDLARALLEMVTINIGSIARMCAANEDIDRVVFIGNFLRVNQLSMKLLSYAVNYWSKGAMKALFLEHEGYFGAVGCFAESTQGCHQ